MRIISAEEYIEMKIYQLEQIVFSSNERLYIDENVSLLVKKKY